MKFGIFDHIDMAGDRPLATQYDERLTFAQAADEAGFYCLHIAEHHASPLNTVPVPGIWLGALARVTKRMRLGPLVYLLPLYSPLRLAEEICILDHLSKGRLDVGVGRGVSPFELAYHKIKHDDSRDIFADAYKALNTALTSELFSYESERYNYKNVPMPLRPLQQPTPPMWYGSSNATGSAWAGDHGLHFASNGPTERARGNIQVFREHFAKHGKPAHPKPEFEGGVVVGVGRQIVVAETEAEALRIAKPAAEHHHANLTYLLRVHASDEAAKRFQVPTRAGLEEQMADGSMIVGTPATVAEKIAEQVETMGLNYMMAYLFFGTMQLSDALRSLELFRSEVMPKFAK
ncbi:MAG TPA: LLM class flavin-dependent oxidoreductase [Beijerinckiaceae bacterium]|jgi:alkanesulfonate monooxygenase SsuD/methylene tetrahydromethanopterin reductase-like flavin-dependent oxidoreductase (luciferase family)|nr:LLM class flavin-dependent oxidoreductase [Beijerinckiaceae bacterium]